MGALFAFRTPMPRSHRVFRVALSALLGCSLSLFAVDVSAQETPADDRARASVGKRGWYGWRTGLVDAAAVGLMVAGGFSDGAVVAAGVATYAFVPPVVHAVHRNGVGMMASLGLRIGAPISGALVGALAADCLTGEESCGLGHVISGFFVGMLTASIVDVVVLSREPDRVVRHRDSDPAPYDGAPAIAVHVAPILRSNGVGLGVGAAF